MTHEGAVLSMALSFDGLGVCQLKEVGTLENMLGHMSSRDSPFPLLPGKHEVGSFDPFSVLPGCLTSPQAQRNGVSHRTLKNLGNCKPK